MADTDHIMVSVEDVLETIRDMAHYPDHLFVAQDLLHTLELRLCRIGSDARKPVSVLKKQTPKPGKWIISGEPPIYIIKCSECGQKYFSHTVQPIPYANYCSACGANMESIILEVIK